MAHHNTVCAQMLKFIPTCLSLPAAGRRRSTTYSPLGVSINDALARAGFSFSFQPTACCGRPG